MGVPVAPAYVVAAIVAGAGIWLVDGRWRRLLVVAGFPMSAALLAGDKLPAWSWLLALGALLLLYPLRSWRDAPLFPTPPGALEGLSAAVELPSEPHIVDAGCGTGDGLRALRGAWPDATLTGWEWSWPLVLVSRLRAGAARVRRQDIWRADWSTFDAVYLFQRPESMPRALDKASRELKPGAWLLSLEFEATGWVPDVRHEVVPGKPVWGYRAPLRRR